MGLIGRFGYGQTKKGGWVEERELNLRKEIPVRNIQKNSDLPGKRFNESLHKKVYSLETLQEKSCFRIG